jgi:hypothetical protein
MSVRKSVTPSTVPSSQIEETPLPGGTNGWMG